MQDTSSPSRDDSPDGLSGDAPAVVPRPNSAASDDNGAKPVPPEGGDGGAAPEQGGAPDGDASRLEVITYSIGTTTNDLCGTFFHVLKPILVITLNVNPLAVGLILAIKTIWDSLTDPVMAYITDNFESRWGRRRPFILLGGLLMPLIFVMAWFFMPKGDNVTPNIEEKPPIEVRAETDQPAQTPIDVVAAEAGGDLADAVSPEELVAVTPDGVESSAALDQGEARADSPDEASGKKEPVVKPKERKSLWQNLTAGFAAMGHMSSGERNIVFYVIVMMLLLATAQTIYSVAYYALGIELSPSYDGRTQVVTYRALLQKGTGILKQWFVPFAMLGIFTDAVDGMKYVAILVLVLSIPATLFMFFKTKERTRVSKKSKKMRMGIFRGVWETIKNVHILRLLLITKGVGFSIGIFAQLGLYINIYYVFGGDKQAGSAMGAKVAMLAWVLGLASLPLLRMLCQKFEKHTTLRFAIVMVILGCVLKWFCMNPHYPQLQYILPFFFSVGIGGFYLVLQTMMADVTDYDELVTGERREAMIGAVMAFVNKALESFQHIAAGAVLVAAGFIAEMGADQAPGVITNMRLMFSIVPGVMLCFCLLLLWRYPLTQKKVQEIKEELRLRHEAESKAEHGAA